MTQISTLCPRAVWREDGGPVSDRVENVKNSSARQRWWWARRDGGEREGGVGIVSRWNEQVEGGLDAVLRERSSRSIHMHTHPYYIPLLLPTQGTASMTTKPFPVFVVFFFFFSLTTKPEVLCISQQLFRCYLWQHIRCISPLFITLHRVTTELACEGNIHINNLSDRFR